MMSTNLHRLLLTSVAVLIFGQVVAFCPSSTPPESPASSEGSAAQKPQKDQIFKGFSAPDGASPDYSIRQFRYVSVEEGKKQWQLKAAEALFFSSRQTVLTTDVQAELFSDGFPQTSAVKVTGREARYLLNTRDLEVGGNVVALLDNGAEIRSEYLKFIASKRVLIVPSTYSVWGRGPGGGEMRIQFKSSGLEATLATRRLLLPSLVEVQVIPPQRNLRESPTTFRSARAEVLLSENQVVLSSDPSALGREMVTMEHPGATRLRARAKTMQVTTLDAKRKTSFTATEDVRIEEWTPKSSTSERPYRYSTSGKAEFFPSESVFFLTEYPQVYQDNDTMTGDVIKVDRKKDQVEVENSNAITSGKYE
ncbi:MAG: LPS export ABC transporter periplasmic protein LptC [Bdellovibrionales bacterium]|nr:LPS export ABC transporter periplasmic protein LptC [Bdellovibrionales bacterium]